MEPTQKTDKSKTASIAVLAIIAAGALGSTAYLYSYQEEMHQLANREQAAKQLALAEKNRVVAELLGSTVLLDGSQNANRIAQDRITELERRLEAAEARAAQLMARASRNEKLTAELNGLKVSTEDLRQQLANAREHELELRSNADRAVAEREALAAQLAQRETGARMVNNAELFALKGHKEKLTVKARRTKEIRMAFDLPEALANGANFKITGPDGKEFTGADPVVSQPRDISDATASVGLTAEPSATSRTSRVDLSYKPRTKLEDGVYRIDISSGKDYLQTVHLKLR